MSFILDALRKSEHERQRQGGPGIADLKPVVIAARLPGWAIALGALLLVNIIVVLVLVLRGPSSRAAPVAEPAATAAQVPATPAGATPAATRPAPDVAPPANQYALPPPVLAQSPRQTEPEASRPAEAGAPAYETSFDEPDGPQLNEGPAANNLPTVNDPEVMGRVPEMHLDLHVYSARPADRFVFVNGRKYREGGVTPEGTRIERITPDGVVLNHRGLRLLMPRQ